MLTQIRISNYRSIADIDLPINKANVIVGPNGAGKSNLIDCLNFLRDCAQEDLDSATTRRHGADSVRRWTKFRPYNVTIELGFSSDRGNGAYKVVLSSSSGAFKVQEEAGHWNGRDLRDRRTSRFGAFQRYANGSIKFHGSAFEDRPSDAPTVSSYDLFLTQISGPFFNPFSGPFRGLSNEITAMSTYAIYPNTIRQPQIVSRDPILANDGSNLAATLKRLNTNQRRLKERLIEALRIVMPSLNDLLVKSAGGFYVPVIRVRESNGEPHEFNMSQLSDGTLRMLGLLTAFYQVGAPKCIVLEEPEQMIHPGLLSLLKDAAEDYAHMRPDNQYIMTTHSPHLLNQFDPEDIIWMSYENGVSNARKISEEKLALVREELFSPGDLLISEGLGL